jgi:hypothetical protein
MARFYKLAKGGQKTAVVESATATLAGAGVEIAVNLTGGLDRAEFARLVEEIKNAALEDRWPPA